MWLAACPALAQPAPAVDYDDRIIDACLSQNWGALNAQESCIGIASRACMPPGEGDAPVAIACFDAERAQWAMRLTESLDALRSQLEPPPGDSADAEDAASAENGTAADPNSAATGRLAALDAMQAAWETWRDAACGFDGALYPGSAVGDVNRADCLMRLTARQAFHLGARLDGDI